MGDADKKAAMASSDDDSSDDDNQAKLGDRLFDSDDGGVVDGHEETKKAAELNGMDPELIKKIIATDSPELQGLL